jgi:hypothetical protein
MGGDRRSATTEAQAAAILARVEATPDLTPEELRAALAAEGATARSGASCAVTRSRAKKVRARRTGTP